MTERVDGDEHAESLGADPSDGAAAGHEAEFDVVAGWTAELVEHRDRTSVLAAACRGSGSPSSLAWLAESLQLEPDRTLLDVGSGLGGALRWAVERYRVQPLAVEPMVAAASGASRLFGHPTVAASALALPLPDASVPTAWLLGVLDTIDRPDLALAEVRRVLGREGRLGVLAYVATETIDDDELPEGNRFQRLEELLDSLRAARLAVVDRVAAARLPDPPVDWVLRQERLRRELERHHGEDPAWTAAAAQERRFRDLLEAGRVEAVLLHAVSV